MVRHIDTFQQNEKKKQKSVILYMHKKKTSLTPFIGTYYIGV